MKLTIEIELGNEAMQTSGDAINAIATSLGRIPSHYGPLEVNDAGKVRDENGNTVGTWIVTP